jgi:A/G-specific adenine glycosylase
VTALLDWYAPRRRAYPWRRRPTPYRVLVSEVMLQQTQASRVAPAFEAFLRRFPTVRALADAPRGDVLRAWGSLGYNRRAVALHGAARLLVREHGARVPREVEALGRLPGVGSYTASAVAAIGHGVPVPAVDVNVRRVVARSRLGLEPHHTTEDRIDDEARLWLDGEDPATWNQAVMDLGREVCRPVPLCEACPLAGECRFRRSGRSPSRPPRRQGRFDGSFRQIRGAVVRVLRERGSTTLGGLARWSGHRPDRIRDAVSALSSEGLVQAGPAALAGRRAGRVRLPG